MVQRMIALLRGINVGGNKKIKMADLRQMMTDNGFINVKTALASGNIAFDSDIDDVSHLTETIAEAIENTFGFTVSVIGFPQRHVIELLADAPFDAITVTDKTRLYVTFLPEPATPTFDIPYHAPDGDFTILSVTDAEVCSVLTLTQTRSVDGMAILEKEFGKTITTRNWNTVRKLATL